MKDDAAAHVRVKICGVTNREDAEAAIALGADALGFNLFPGSRRCISLEREALWIVQLPPFVSRVAVLVNVGLDEARAVAVHPAIDLVQFHGDEDAAYCREFAQTGRPFIKALRLRDAGVLREATHFSTRHLLLDSYKSGAFGGSGTAIDIDLAARFAREHPEIRVIIGGGLTPENVRQVIEKVRPFAVDVASGVEVGAGRKGRELMNAFIENARSAGARR